MSRFYKTLGGLTSVVKIYNIIQHSFRKRSTKSKIRETSIVKYCCITHRIRQSASWYLLSGTKSLYFSRRLAKLCRGNSERQNQAKGDFMRVVKIPRSLDAWRVSKRLTT